MKTGFLAVLTACFALFWAPAGAAEITDSMSGAEIQELLTEAGFGGKIIEDRDTGAPVAIGRLGSINFVVRAMDCAGRPAACKRLLFFANFDLGRPATEADYRAVNDFNEAYFDGRAYVIEAKNQMGVDYFIDLTGGVTTDHVASRLGRWRGVVQSFLEEIRSNGTGS